MQPRPVEGHRVSLRRARSSAQQCVSHAVRHARRIVRDGVGKVVEGSGDSRFHLELAIEIDAHKHARVVARDLDSKNGTCVLRTSCNGFTCFAFPGRRHLGVDDWAERLGVSAEHVCLVDELALERGDIIQLADSCFELI